MRRIGIVVVVSFLAAAAVAQNIRSAVSLTGLDTATCTVPDPCRTFDVAISRTNVGGEVIVLSSAGYGPFTVNKSVSIIASAAYHAAISPTSGDAITVNVDSAVVVLRGLALNGGFGAFNGINFTGQTAAASETWLYVEKCIISGFSNNGLSFARNGRLFVHDTSLRHCGQSGIYINGSPGMPSHGSIDRALLEGNHNGLVVDNAVVAVRDSIATSNLDDLWGAGFWARSLDSGTSAIVSADNCQATHNITGFMAGNGQGGTGTAQLTVSNSVASSNFSGISTYPQGTVRASNNTVTNNNAGFSYTFGTFESRGNNTLRGNNVDKGGTGTIAVFAGE